MIQIVAAGGGLTIDLNKMIIPVTSLVQIAATAGNSGATIIIKNPNFLPATSMIQIATAGRGRVIFEL